MDNEQGIITPASMLRVAESAGNPAEKHKFWMSCKLALPVQYIAWTFSRTGRNRQIARSRYPHDVHQRRLCAAVCVSVPGALSRAVESELVRTPKQDVGDAPGRAKMLWRSCTDSSLTTVNPHPCINSPICEASTTGSERLSASCNQMYCTMPCAPEGCCLIAHRYVLGPPALLRAYRPVCLHQSVAFSSGWCRLSGSATSGGFASASDWRDDK
jgi:hypothetical protein